MEIASGWGMSVLGSIFPILIALYFGFLLGRNKAPTLTKYAYNFKLQQHKIRRMKTKLAFIRKFRISMYGLQILFLISICFSAWFKFRYDYFNTNRTQQFQGNSLCLLESGILESLQRGALLSTAFRFGLCLMRTPIYFLFCYLFGILMAYFVRGALLKYEMMTQLGVSKLKSQQANMVREFAEDLGPELSLQLNNHLHESLSKEHTVAKKELEEYKRKHLTFDSKFSRLKFELKCYKSFVHKTDEFIWCGDCMSHSLNKPVELEEYNSFGHRLRFDNLPSNSEIPAKLVAETKSIGTPPDQLDQLSFKEQKERSLRSNNKSLSKKHMCSRDCLARFIYLYQQEKKLISQTLSSNKLESRHFTVTVAGPACVENLDQGQDHSDEELLAESSHPPVKPLSSTDVRSRGPTSLSATKPGSLSH